METTTDGATAAGDAPSNAFVQSAAGEAIAAEPSMTQTAAVMSCYDVLECAPWDEAAVAKLRMFPDHPLAVAALAYALGRRGVPSLSPGATRGATRGVILGASPGAADVGALRALAEGGLAHAQFYLGRMLEAEAAAAAEWFRRAALQGQALRRGHRRPPGRPRGFSVLWQCHQ